MLSKKIIATIVLSVGVIGAAQASVGRPYTVLNGYGQNSVPTTPTMSAPEIDPASAFSALTFLAAGLTVIRGRVKK